MEKLKKWGAFLPEDDRQRYRNAGHGAEIGYGERPALLNVDSHNLFIDPKYPFCAALDPAELESTIAGITATFRRLNLPLYYVRRDKRDHPVKMGMRNNRYETLRTPKNNDPGVAYDSYADEWPASYAPTEEDVIVYKNKGSAFFGTPLDAWLRYNRIDTLIVCGMTTSGCVRASVTDAFALNFRVTVVEEGCSDLSVAQHRASLFDMDMKLADVKPLETIIADLDEQFR
jgi:nicotinamidase-related amidase